MARSSHGNASGVAEAFRYTAGRSGTAGSIVVYLDIHSGARRLVAGIYSNRDNRPGRLLALGIGVRPTPGRWSTVHLGARPAIRSRTSYWIAVLGIGGSFRFRAVPGGAGGCSILSARRHLGWLPSNWSSGKANTPCRASAYVASMRWARAAPVNTRLPQLIGQAGQGLRLAARDGSWRNGPTSATHRWLRCNASGAACMPIPGASSAAYALTAADIAHTIRVVVTARNAAGTASATSAASAIVFAAVAGPPAVTCTITIGGGLASTLSAAAPGTNICLEPGSYPALTINTRKTAMVTVTDAPGVTPAQVVVGSIDVRASSNITFAGLTLAGADIGIGEETAATHIHFVDDVFTKPVCINTPQDINQDTLIVGSSFNGLGQSCNEARIGINGAGSHHTVNNGVVISDDVIGNGGAADGIQIDGDARGTEIGPGNQFVNLDQDQCGSVHCDSIQFYGASHTSIVDNYFADDSSMLGSFDGNGSPMYVSGNVFANQIGNPPYVGGGRDDVFDHNTFNSGLLIACGNVGASAGETITNNIITSGLQSQGGCAQATSTFTIAGNLIPRGGLQGEGNIVGRPTWVGGASPTSCLGFMLAAGSPGKNAVPGTDVGADDFGLACR